MFPKILDLKSSSEQIFFRKLSLGAPESATYGQLNTPSSLGLGIFRRSVEERKNKNINNRLWAFRCLTSFPLSMTVLEFWRLRFNSRINHHNELCLHNCGLGEEVVTKLRRLHACYHASRGFSLLLGLRSRWRGLFVAWLVYGQLRDRQATPTTSQTLKAMKQRNQGNACGKGFWGELPLLISCYNNGILEDESKQKASIAGNGRC